MDREQLHLLMRALGFPAGLWARAGEGLLAHFDARDRLVAMYWIRDNAPVGQNLELDDLCERGEMRWPNGSGGSADSEIYEDGHWERFDAWSDGSRPSAMPWSDWVIKGVTSFAEKCRCTLCGTGLGEARPAAYSPCERRFLCGACKQWTREGVPSTRSLQPPV